MRFLVKHVGYNPDSSQKNIMFLIEDRWDDWFRYETMYDLGYVDEYGEYKYIGKIKIAEIEMESDQRRPNIPNEFELLDKNFYSLGQSDYYYENLNRLGEKIRKEVLQSLNDIALDIDLFEEVRDFDVTRSSLMRDISVTTVLRQFNRIANGGVRLTEYNFKFISPKDEKALSDPMELSFSVIPESNPPTNIHVVIGRNGVGKTRLIKNMIKSLIYSETDENTGEFFVGRRKEKPFANVICVAFSAFDEFSSIVSEEAKNDDSIPFINIGLPLHYECDNSNKINDRLFQLAKLFVESVNICIHGAKYNMWSSAILNLESDPIFKDANIRKLKDYKGDEFKENAFKLFDKLSSGHKIILLTITKLVEVVEETSLIILDEPEGHLHPPLLSAFIRALSELLIDRNGVAIIATHSPVVLQEVPRSCIWKLRRSGREAIAERLEIESFGENLGSLTREVFGYEVTHSGFHKMLREAAEKYRSYNRVVNHFNNELGMEAKAILRALIADLDNEEQ
ncbi:AAA family ATPase [Tissierella sp.]|uniref:AAA family ATPase n=1 Tax=Tissierella sp. TaxID=41274 RepID=UPI0030430BAC